MTEAKRRKLVERVAKLLAHAEGTNHDDERDAFIAKADALMVTYAIEQWELEQRQGREREEPISERLDALIDGASPLRDELADLVMACAAHARVRVVFGALDRPKRERHPIDVTWVGFESDVSYAQLLYTTLHLQLARAVDPTADPEAGYEANLVALKEAGLTWETVHARLARVGLEPFASETHTYSHAVKLSKDYARICRETGREQLKTNPTQYRRNFAYAFVAEVRRRLTALRRTARSSDEPGTALVLADRGTAVKAKVAEVFPKLRHTRAAASGVNHGARAAGRAAGAQADLGQARVGRRKELP